METVKPMSIFMLPLSTSAARLAGHLVLWTAGLEDSRALGRCRHGAGFPIGTGGGLPCNLTMGWTWKQANHRKGGVGGHDLKGLNHQTRGDVSYHIVYYVCVYIYISVCVCVYVMQTHARRGH